VRSITESIEKSDALDLTQKEDDALD